MNTKKQLKLFTGELLNTRRVLQDGRCLTDSEQQTLRSSIESLLLDLDANINKNAFRVSSDVNRSNQDEMQDAR